MNKPSASTYSYAEFTNDILALLDGELELTNDKAAEMRDKTIAFQNTLKKRAEYNANHPRKGVSKLSDTTKANIEKISGVLKNSTKPMTTSDINAALHADLTPLQVANAVKYIEGIKSTKAIREAVDKKGLKAQKEYTAYYIG